MKKGDFVICTSVKTIRAYGLPITIGKEYTILSVSRHEDMFDIVADNSCILSFESYRFKLSPRGIRNNVIDNIVDGL